LSASQTSTRTTLPANIGTIWTISDGTAGMRLQAVALADALAAARHPKTGKPARTRAKTPQDFVVTPPPLCRYLPRLGQIWPVAALDRMLASDCPELPVGQEFPDILITCGRRMAGLSIAMRRLARYHGAPTRTIHIQDPRLPAHYFDILIVPQHDPTRGPNVITCMASLNRLTMPQIADAAAHLAPQWTSLPAPCVAVLLGGDNRRYRITDPMATAMAARLADFARSNKASLALIPSRRTPASVVNILMTQLGDSRVIIATAADANPYPGILGIADAVIVTSDSVNMASEAALTGKPLLIAAWQPETGRIAAFHQVMARAGHSAPLGTKLPTAGFTPLAEMPDIVASVSALLADAPAATRRC